MSPGLLKGAERATAEAEGRFHSLANLIDVPALKRAYRRMRKDAAVGVDGVTKEQYGYRVPSAFQRRIDPMIPAFALHSTADSTARVTSTHGPTRAMGSPIRPRMPPCDSVIGPRSSRPQPELDHGKVSTTTKPLDAELDGRPGVGTEVTHQRRHPGRNSSSNARARSDNADWTKPLRGRSGVLPTGSGPPAPRQSSRRATVKAGQGAANREVSAVA